MKIQVCIAFASMAIASVANAEVDIALGKSVDIATPTQGEPVEFTVVAANIGDQDEPAVVVVESLPPELAIPAGMAAFPSIGSYDPDTGEWTLGLDAGESAQLIVPAVITAESQPECIVNTAFLASEDLEDDTNDESRAAVYREGVARCVDLNASIVFLSTPLFASCDQFGDLSGTVDVSNMGPDDAREVTVTLTVEAGSAPNVRFNDEQCSNESSTTCSISAIAAGEVVSLIVESDEFQSYMDSNQGMSLSVVSTDFDYNAANNTHSRSVFINDFSDCNDTGPDLGLVEVGPTPCFIATAAYGSPLDERIDVLRHFRDNYLMTHAPGKALVGFYYRYSPPIADFIASRDRLRSVVRGALWPIVFSIENPAALLLLMAGATAWLARRRRQRLALKVSGAREIHVGEDQ